MGEVLKIGPGISCCTLVPIQYSRIFGCTVHHHHQAKVWPTLFFLYEDSFLLLPGGFKRTSFSFILERFFLGRVEEEPSWEGKGLVLLSFTILCRFDAAFASAIFPDRWTTASFPLPFSLSLSLTYSPDKHIHPSFP